MKIKCIYKNNPDDKWFTVGKIYEVKNGELKDNDCYTWTNLNSIERINEKFEKYFKFELVSDTPTKPTLKQLKALKPGDKVRLRSDRGPIWNRAGEMDEFFNQIVTIATLRPTVLKFDIVENGRWVFELTDIVEIITTKQPPTKEQLMNLKVGDKVRIGDAKYQHWVSGMDKYRNQVVTIDLIREDKMYFKIEEDRERWYFLLYKEVKGELQSDIVEIISDEPPTPTETIPEKKEKPTVEQITPEAFKEAVINFLSKLPYTGGTVSFAICEAERARIIEGIRELDIT